MQELNYALKSLFARFGSSASKLFLKLPFCSDDENEADNHKKERSEKGYTPFVNRKHPIRSISWRKENSYHRNWYPYPSKSPPGLKHFISHKIGNKRKEKEREDREKQHCQ